MNKGFANTGTTTSYYWLNEELAVLSKCTDWWCSTATSEVKRYTLKRKGAEYTDRKGLSIDLLLLSLTNTK